MVLLNRTSKQSGDAAEDAAPEPIVYGLHDEDKGDRYAAGAEVESLLDVSGEQIFENATLTGGDSNNVFVVNIHVRR